MYVTVTSTIQLLSIRTWYCLHIHDDYMGDSAIIYHVAYMRDDDDHGDNGDTDKDISHKISLEPSSGVFRWSHQSLYDWKTNSAYNDSAEFYARGLDSHRHHRWPARCCNRMSSAPSCSHLRFVLKCVTTSIFCQFSKTFVHTYSYFIHTSCIPKTWTRGSLHWQTLG